MEIGIILLVIIIFSIVQSIFGIGLLIFGTPTLLILDFSFVDSLKILLLPSIAINFLQIINQKTHNTELVEEFKKSFIYSCLPFLIFGLLIMKFAIDFINLSFLIGLLLLMVSLLRSHSRLNELLSNYLSKYKKVGNIFLGIIHGLTNMGGSFLLILATTAISDDKTSTKYTVAYCYFIMGVIQYCFISIFFTLNITYMNFFYIIFPVLIYKTIGNRLFVYIQNYQYQRLITLFIFIYGILLLINQI